MTQWRIHIGAHKTATTHLQATLEYIGDDLRTQGVEVATMTRLRDVTGAHLRKQGLRARLARRNRQADLARVFQGVSPGTERVILSEENWIGEAFAGAACPPYPDAATRLSRIVAALPGHDISLYLAIRHPGDFASSVYAEALRHHPGKVSAASTRKNWLSTQTPWSDLIARLRHCCPSAEILVWRYEDYRTRRQQITERLVGMALPELPKIDDPGSTIRPTPEMISEAAPRRDRPAFHVLDGRFSLFSQAEHDALTRQYETDQDMIRLELPKWKTVTLEWL